MSLEKPLVSIITPSYNQGRFIEETILSVKNQTYPRIEHIVVDGGSTDGTLNILRSYSDSVIWVSEPDKGQSDAINKGWRMSKGEILAYLNSDDTYMPWTVETAVKHLLENPGVGMVYGDCAIIDECSQATGQYPAAEFNLSDLICGRNMIPQPTVFLWRRVLETAGYLDVNLNMAMDYDLWIRIGLGHRLKYIPERLASFRVHRGTKSAEQPSQWGPEHLRILDGLFSSPTLPGELKALRRRAYSNLSFVDGIRSYSLCHMKEARKNFMKAIVMYPQSLAKSPLLIACLITSFMGARVTRLLVAWKRQITPRTWVI